jgi:carboxymethylenebutenolidase
MDMQRCAQTYTSGRAWHAGGWAAKVQVMGELLDDQVLGDVGQPGGIGKHCLMNGKVGVFGTCSGGRHAFLSACRIPGFAAVVDCWGGRVVMTPEELTPKQPVAPVDYTADLSCPVLGIFGNEDHSPTPEQVNQLEEALKQHGKSYEFHRYDGAGHGFFYHNRPNYRQEQAVDGWNKVFAFLDRTQMRTNVYNDREAGQGDRQREGRFRLDESGYCQREL